MGTLSAENDILFKCNHHSETGTAFQMHKFKLKALKISV